jgi:hypothetical protein
MPEETRTEIKIEEDVTFSPSRKSAKGNKLLKKKSPISLCSKDTLRFS